ncbi:MAG: VanZ family protein [Eubacteriales bacterium]|nr:VanZ family protein [Eubacteriales bacterium]
MFRLFSTAIDVASGVFAVLPFLILLEILARRVIPSLPLKHLIGDGLLCCALTAALSVAGVPERLLLFLPAGLLLPLLFSPFQRLPHCAFYGLGLSLAVEALHLFSLRSSGLAGLCADTLGILAGYGLFRLFSALAPGVRSVCLLPDGSLERFPSLKKECAALTVSALAAALFLTPVMKGMFWSILL